MSFILDALKKAESERSRQAGPVLMDMRLVAPRQGLPAWAWLLACVLLANLLVLAWLLLRKPAPAPPVAATQNPAVVQPAAPVAPARSPAVVLEPGLAPAPADFTPAPGPAAAILPAQPPPPTAFQPALPRIDNLPTARDLVAQGISLPTLTLNLHVYDEIPANRYVLLNARRLREGDEVADGIRIETIVPAGVILNARGRRFALLAGG